MRQRSDLIYLYDGSYEGFLCCVFEAFLAKERPADIVTEDKLEPTLFSVKWIATDYTKAVRVIRGFEKRLRSDSIYLIENGLYCCCDKIELMMLDFIIFAFEHSKGSATSLGDKEVSELQKAVLALKRESHSFIEFIRFSEYDGGLVSVIEPKNKVLPTIAPHFCDRFPNELFLIYDKTHQSALIHKGGKCIIADGVEDFVEPQPGAEELFYRELWSSYFDAISIKERENPRCQQNHLPLRYRRHMTEFSNRQVFSETRLIPGK